LKQFDHEVVVEPPTMVIGRDFLEFLAHLVSQMLVAGILY
jgi:hypothetical protein